MRDEFIAVMLKHLPPSGAQLHLLDVGGVVGEPFLQQRKDLHRTTINGAAANWQLAPLSFDAVMACNVELTADFLAACLTVLRPGGRLIVVDAHSRAGAEHVRLLEDAGYTRILVEPALADGTGALLRGEKPHTEARTVDRIQQVAGRDAPDTAAFRGRYVHLLIRQTPNKPVWALKPDDVIEWHAAALNRNDNGPVLLAFTSLPKAVAFMQPAVMQGVIVDINKVGKFSRETAQAWPLLLNPTLDAVAGQDMIFYPVDSQAAEAPDE